MNNKDIRKMYETQLDLTEKNKQRLFVHYSYNPEMIRLVYT